MHAEQCSVAFRLRDLTVIILYALRKHLVGPMSSINCTSCTLYLQERRCSPPRIPY